MNMFPFKWSFEHVTFHVDDKPLSTSSYAPMVYLLWTTFSNSWVLASVHVNLKVNRRGFGKHLKISPAFVNLNAPLVETCSPKALLGSADVWNSSHLAKQLSVLQQDVDQRKCECWDPTLWLWMTSLGHIQLWIEGTKETIHLQRWQWCSALVWWCWTARVVNLVSGLIWTNRSR